MAKRQGVCDFLVGPTGEVEDQFPWRVCFIISLNDERERRQMWSEEQ